MGLAAVDATAKDVGNHHRNDFRLYPFGRNLCYQTLVEKAKRNADYLRDHFRSQDLEKSVAAPVMTHHIPFGEEFTSDRGLPMVIEHANAPAAQIYRDLASNIHARMPEYLAGRTRRVFTARAADWKWIMGFEI